MSIIEIVNYSIAAVITVLFALMMFMGASWCVYRLNMSKVMYFNALVVSALIGLCMYILAISLNSLYS